MAIPNNVERTAVAATAGRRPSADGDDGGGEDIGPSNEPSPPLPMPLPLLLLRLPTAMSRGHSRDDDTARSS